MNKQPKDTDQGRTVLCNEIVYRKNTSNPVWRVCLLVEGRGSRVEGKWSRVEGKKSRVVKFFTIICERRQIKILYRFVLTRVSGARFIE